MLVSCKKFASGNALQLAAYQGHVEVVKLLLPLMDNMAINSALFWAITGGQETVMEILIGSGADVRAPLVNCKSIADWSPWHNYTHTQETVKLAL